MTTAKLFKHGGSQAVRLPKEFRFDGTEVAIEKRGDEVILRPKPRLKLKTLADLARHMRERFPQGARFPDREQPREQQKRDLNLD
ncbi:MAG: AbrB/MazE/SpoVT family DNA-binding domain-containing protein [Verrucomicrobiia bacterium]|jgi:antitoxin VapB